MLTICFSALPAQGEYGGGTGEPNDPYLIYDANQMNAIGADSNDWDKHFKLMADIDLSVYTGTSFNIIGERYYDSGWIENPFTGVFDGNGHTISNFSYTATDGDYIGLFGYVSDPNAEIKNLSLIDPNINTETVGQFGSLVGYLEHGTLTGCSVDGGSISLGSGGGLVGINSGTISDCSLSANVSGDIIVGGLVGQNWGGTISNCYSNGTVSGISQVGGGLVGANSGTITNCHSSATVSGLLVLGGLVGGNGGTITNCYTNGCVSGQSILGGLVGGHNSGSYTKCFWDNNVNPGLPGIGNTTNPNVIGESTTNMQIESTFTDAGWDFVGESVNGTEDIWKICEGEDYPRLQWEKYGGGTGESGNPYLIYTSCQMNAIGADSNDWDKHFKLRADIDLGDFTGGAFNIIGIDDYNGFTGVFDGNSHTNSNFIYGLEHGAYIGLLGYVKGFNAHIKDLRLIDPNVDAGTGWHVGSLVGSLEHGTISGCGVAGGSISASGPVGGFVGANADGTITSCWCSGSVSGGQGVGGLAGANTGTIINCYSSTNVSGAVVVAGFVAFNHSTIANCYAVGTTYGLGMVGGLVASNDGGTVVSSFWDVNSTGQTTSAGGIPKTTDEMQTKTTFTNWDFVSTWDICEATNYPRLLWQIPRADFVCPDGVDMRDFAVLGAQWWQPPGEPSADIAPDGGNGIVDWFDLAALVENWLTGL